MAKQAMKSKGMVATIDCALITIQTATGEFGFDTANKLGVEPQVESQDAVRLVVKNILRAQKPEQSTIVGHKLTLTDNVFNPPLVLVMQGGTIYYDPVDTDKVVGYDPPVAGSGESGEEFIVNAYSAQYDGAGNIVNYERISYPHCYGVPVAFNSEDGVFRVPEYTINSAPNTGEKPYSLRYVNALPVLVDEYTLSELVLASVAGDLSGDTAITVTPTKEEYDNTYLYKVDASEITLPLYGVVPDGWTTWDGVADITAATDSYVAIVECDKDGKALAGGQVQAVAKA